VSSNKSQSGFASTAFRTGVISLSLAALATVAALTAIALATPLAIAQQVLPVRVDRCLELQQITGTVTYRRGQTSAAAQIHTCLEEVGDTLITGQNSSAKLGIDTGIGTISVSENTTLQVQKLDTASDGGKITLLKVTGGQVQLRVRAFTHRESILEIQTPAGVSGVRGTEFGVSVQPSGATGVATLEGSVAASAQGQTVDVDAGLQSRIIPGEPPLPPSPLKDDPSLDIRYLAIVRPSAVGQRTVRIVGQIDPVNLLVIADQTQNVERSGEFDLQIPLPTNRQISAVVITPLGTRQAYELVVP
jgi:hypothetical protein